MKLNLDVRKRSRSFGGGEKLKMFSQPLSANLLIKRGVMLIYTKMETTNNIGLIGNTISGSVIQIPKNTIWSE
jgi:hypothetical protein